MIPISRFMKKKMVKVYMFIYAMIIFFFIFISTTNSAEVVCRRNHDCRGLVCILPLVQSCVLTEKIPEKGICTCVERAYLILWWRHMDQHGCNYLQNLTAFITLEASILENTLVRKKGGIIR
ncbi:unnamed protein product [Trifolium pratense]|uniref:Uncharacterized protein n=1 Tax=Trifolium pratense TaxID=57577 RepID=A0ACB0L9Q6_TRIPR|nr:unnamed protein product [Trifolium pratense]